MMAGCCRARWEPKTSEKGARADLVSRGWATVQSFPDLLCVQASVRCARQGECVSGGREGGAGEGMLRQGGGCDPGDGLPAHQGAWRRRVAKSHRIHDISRYSCPLFMLELTHNRVPQALKAEGVEVGLASQPAGARIALTSALPHSTLLRRTKQTLSSHTSKRAVTSTRSSPKTRTCSSSAAGTSSSSSTAKAWARSSAATTLQSVASTTLPAGPTQSFGIWRY